MKPYQYRFEKKNPIKFSCLGFQNKTTLAVSQIDHEEINTDLKTHVR